MKMKIKNILAVVVLSISAITYSAQALDLSASLTHGANVTNIIDGGCKVTSLSIVNGGVNPVVFALVDSGNTNSSTYSIHGWSVLSYSNGAYTSYISYPTNISFMYTNFQGVTNVKTYRGSATVTNLNISATNSFYKPYSGVAAAGPNVTTTFTLGGDGLIFARGVSITNNALTTNVVINLTYHPHL